MGKLYFYVGPAEIKVRVANAPAGQRIGSVNDFLDWIQTARPVARPDGLIAATFVITHAGDLLVADRRSEHVACASGGPVLSAGEIFFLVTGMEVEVREVTNQSTGFCPGPESWPVVAKALDQAGISHPGGFTTQMVFRRCDACGQRNIVKDGWFVCGICETELPAEWNF